MNGQMTGQPSWSIPREQSPDFDAVFQAIAAPTRRSILDILRDGAHVTAKDIGDQLNEVSRQALSHHLRVLRDAELIEMERDGQSWRYSLNTDPLASIYRIWLGRYVPADAEQDTKQDTKQDTEQDTEQRAKLAGATDGGHIRTERSSDEPPLRVLSESTDHEPEVRGYEHETMNVDDRLARLSERIQRVAAAPKAIPGRHSGHGERRSPTELNRALGRIAAEISAKP